ncbi:hypothetical protein [Streptomyces iconiensis]|uniref:Uncharacterized protein n=1 Tax=Streptomyces iconiensis TaxID=1384038 RepID=A0ABT7A4J7_9ACTN|nr:hypothetical protein [Streptomyces iconiensis]MDJ1135954.1 hypothetical protein [Streptomyces iconiensis]
MNANATRYDKADRGRYDKWTFKTMNDQRTKGYHATRAARRRIVAAHLTTTALGLAAVIGAYAASRPWLLAVLVAAMMVWTPLTGLLNSMTRGLLELRTRLLDERQLAERGTVHTFAHRITGWALTAALFAFLVASLAGASLASLTVPLAATGLALLVVQRLLPLWIAAVRVADEPEDEE